MQAYKYTHYFYTNRIHDPYGSTTEIYIPHYNLVFSMIRTRLKISESKAPRNNEPFQPYMEQYVTRIHLTEIEIDADVALSLHTLLQLKNQVDESKTVLYPTVKKIL